MPGFTPAAYLFCFGGLIGCATLSWATILRHDLGLRPASCTATTSTSATAASAATTAASTAASAATATCASSAGAKPKYPAPSEETSCLLNEQPQATPRRVQGVAQRIAPVCLVAWPVAAVTWGLGPSLLQFATAHAACSCDPTSDVARHTYSCAACLISSARPRTRNAHGMRRPWHGMLHRYAVSLSFLLMPCAGLVSYACPSFRLSTLAALALAHLGLAGCLVAAATGTVALSCSRVARILVVLCVAATRALETYITSCSFLLVVRRLEGEPALQRRASLGFGQGMMLVLLGCGLLAFVLVETETVSCSLPAESTPSTGRV